MFENPRRGRQAKNFTTNVPKILDLKSSSEQVFSKNWRWVPLYAISFNSSNSGNFSWSWILNECNKVLEKKNKVVVSCSRPAHAMGEVRQWRPSNVQKSVMHVQSCCFANLNLLLFWRSRWRRRHRCLIKLPLRGWAARWHIAQVFAKNCRLIN